MGFSCEDVGSDFDIQIKERGHAHHADAGNNDFFKRQLREENSRTSGELRGSAWRESLA